LSGRSCDGRHTGAAAAMPTWLLCDVRRESKRSGIGRFFSFVRSFFNARERWRIGDCNIPCVLSTTHTHTHTHTHCSHRCVSNGREFVGRRQRINRPFNGRKRRKVAGKFLVSGGPRTCCATIFSSALHLRRRSCRRLPPSRRPGPEHGWDHGCVRRGNVGDRRPRGVTKHTRVDGDGWTVTSQNVDTRGE